MQLVSIYLEEVESIKSAFESFLSAHEVQESKFSDLFYFEENVQMLHIWNTLLSLLQSFFTHLELRQHQTCFHLTRQTDRQTQLMRQFMAQNKKYKVSRAELTSAPYYQKYCLSLLCLVGSLAYLALAILRDPVLFQRDKKMV